MSYLVKIPYYVAISYIGVFLIISVFATHIRCSVKQVKRLMVLFTVSMAVIAFYWDPKETDLTRNFRYMDIARHSKESFIMYVFNSNYREKAYDGLVAYNALRYLVIRYTDNNHFLPAIATLIDYGIFSYILCDWNVKNNRIRMPSILTIAVCFTFLPFIYVNSGIRNALATSIMALAIYNYIMKKNGIGWFVFVSIIAITIHPVAVVAVPFAFMTKLNWGWKGLIGVFLVSFLIQISMTFWSTSSNSILRRIASYYNFYTSAEQYTSASYYLWGDIVLLLVYIISYVLTYTRRTNDVGRELQYWTLMYGVFVLGYIGNYDLILRPLYLLGTLSPTITSCLEEDGYWKNRLVQGALSLLVVVLGVYVIMRYMRFYFIWKN